MPRVLRPIRAAALIKRRWQLRGKAVQRDVSILQALTQWRMMVLTERLRAERALQSIADAR
ncbi:MAG TPA: hypothetical protein VFB85_19175 [Vicinamibacterales bacterium]|nr:hypothetical protein [Vicinamibacterales bacterium]